ncbi:Nif3-like dinuclear metal center hexameric protein [Catalinimonas niigatensis]|uniref:Nif3-like dinuclear metal center hexameric protein n=1 Tax=Catalinimonas niigatensis TaxID=1397264 RepID=UPI002664EC8A|nr:Nif3-like dinuclear metal center hexameric protein [Catalinimonas niigatensis]WPP51662.1 Nif3-like dinuclear metal center hexameric protein [Catalinimonas niigatensis]
MKHTNADTSEGRRKFLTSLSSLVGTSMVIPIPGISLAENVAQPLSVKEVIDIILKEIPGAPFPKTVDQLITGTPEQEVTGIVTTMFPTVEVIEQTAEAGANMIIAHETPFYNHQDETDWLEQDEAYQHKVALINKHEIAIWRFHDYWHRHQPDGIIMGNLIKLGWEKYYDPSQPRLLTFPEPMPLKSIVALIKERLGISTLRLVGNINQECRTVYLAFGYMDSKMQIGAIQTYQPHLILSGETREWETVERVRDGLQMGQKTSLLVLSHAVSEEAGMEYAATWLQAKVSDTKVMHIASTNPFTFL